MHSLFQLLFTISLLALIAAMIRPALAGRFISTPTRKQILVRLLPILFVTAALSSMTKPKMADDAESVSNDGGIQGQAYAATDMSEDKRDFLNMYATAKTVIQKAQQSPQVNNGICGNAINELVGYMKSGSAADIANYARSGSPDMGYKIAANQLNNYVGVTRNYCGVSMW
ncbi:hypothetical protein PP715_23010 [Ralstonia solanacearum]|uniref:hypothetical protein n=1 Tax=Ralstonia solanacearum TaxID=305 RepID=UPI0005AC20BB|nr:hypothetical protein [Ralstonia solanacearum]AMP70059.1 hypothetical protein UW163_11550 [Ralstonia solanacearum]MBB6587275.1 hypothetical protein [Ralstonia solanacearum]MCL9842692.1 hypothetical protein [Ralstonia solanacearum]MDB0534820.1 hypothetical protein [Ralstonia solanacearum]MDB0539573.1 hypothetical protein [Ralstonia solanacearum]